MTDALMPTTTVGQETSLSTAGVFHEISLGSWDSLDKADLLLAAPSTICVLADLLFCCTREDVVLSITQTNKYQFFEAGSTMKSSTSKVVHQGFEAMLTSFESMQTTLGLCETITDHADTILELAGYFNPLVRSEDFDFAIEESMQQIATQVQSIVTASERVSSTFHLTAEMIGEFLEVLTYTFDVTAAEQRSMAGKFKVFESKEKGARTFRDGLDKHADELKKTFEEDLERYEKRIKEIPSGSEVMATNLAQLALDDLEIVGSLALVAVSKNPLGLKKTWDSFSKSVDSYQPKESSDDGKPARESAEDMRIRLKQLSQLSNTTLLEAHFLSFCGLILQKGLEAELKWDDIPSITKDILPLLQVELELANDAVEVSFKAASGRSITWDPKQIRGLIEDGIQLCKDLDAVNKSRNPDKSKTAIATIKRLSSSIRKINNSRNVLAGVLGLPRPSKKVDGTKKEKQVELAGDKALNLSIQAMKTSQGALDTSRVLYEDSLNSLFKSNRELIDLIGKTESTKVRGAQAQTLLKSMAAPVAFLSQMHVSFYSILSLFGSLKNLVQLYIKVYDSSIKEGISLVIRMQNLLMADDKDIPALIDAHRTKVLGWAKASQTMVTDLVTAEREAKLVAIKKRIEEMSNQIKKAEIQAAKSGGGPALSNSDEDMKVAEEFQRAYFKPSDVPMKQAKRVLASFG
ncbi:hypothetical protein CPB83DRAFT_848758 [Crepidotus variabilis]|uniref:Uncharacterized protein n=1 Tax=Crepidotus variabilis TaxID=179855 RepID=A0A9P6JSZ1_9AGAR|nr:hypothetical protein CPB83DRAFT_848758 [Crepidotus variabilis]